MILAHHPLVNSSCKDWKNFSYNWLSSSLNIAVTMAISGSIASIMTSVLFLH
ncbi:hypothetical protein LguiA_029922 [Lonicera macranthoides]